MVLAQVANISQAKKWTLLDGNNREIELSRETVLGREESCDLCIQDDRISRKHTLVTVQPNGLLVEDLGSANGTFLNGKRVVSPILCKAGDKITCASVDFVVKVIQPIASEWTLQNDSGRVFPVKGQMNVGREAHCDIHIDNQKISRRHALLKILPSGLFVEDLASSNGTFVNDKRILQETRLSSGDKLRFGDQIFSVVRNVDPDATSIIDSDLTQIIDPDITRVVPVSPSKREEFIEVDENAPAERPFFPVPDGAPAASETKADEPEPISAEGNLQQKKRSAIEKQGSFKGQPIRLNRPPLRTGTWVVYKDKMGRSQTCRLVSITGSKSTKYTFEVHRVMSFFNNDLTEKLVLEQEKISYGLKTGAIKVLRRAPFLSRISGKKQTSSD